MTLLPDPDPDPNPPVAPGAVVAAPVGAARGKPERKLGVTVAVPSYPAQPGTVVFGGARPPPQSMKEQISPVPGTYQMRLAANCSKMTCVETQPLRSVLASAGLAQSNTMAARMAGKTELRERADMMCVMIWTFPNDVMTGDVCRRLG